MLASVIGRIYAIAKKVKFHDGLSFLYNNNIYVSTTNDYAPDNATGASWKVENGSRDSDSKDSKNNDNNQGFKLWQHRQQQQHYSWHAPLSLQTN